MNVFKSAITNCILFSMILGITTTSFAATSAMVEFFSSNNTHEIDVKKAYQRLASKAQQDLKDSAIDVFQNSHVEQGRFEDILGMYQMASDKKMTGDNTIIFYASPLQGFSKEQVFSLAAQLANVLQQESVAVFIPSNKPPIADIFVKFKSRRPHVTEAINMIREKLPTYATAFSLHLNRKCSDSGSGFDSATVTEIEWLGNKVNINDIKKAFPQESISYSQGQAYLVYKNGQAKIL